MALFPAYITIQIWGYRGWLSEWNHVLLQFFRTFHELNEGDDDTYEMSLADISYQNTVGDTEFWIMLYVYTDVYGLEGTDTFGSICRVRREKS